MESFAAIVNGWKLLTIVIKHSILDVRGSPSYASDYMAQWLKIAEHLKDLLNLEIDFRLFLDQNCWQCKHEMKNVFRLYLSLERWIFRKF